MILSLLREVPLSHTEMLDEARTVMVKNGHDGIASAIGIEPYSGSWKSGKIEGETSGSELAPSKSTYGSKGAVRKPMKPYSQMSGKEKADLCCRGFNSTAGCNRSACRFRHKCSKVDGDKVCWDVGHNLTTHY